MNLLCQVDILQIAVLEFTERPGCLLFHLEHYIDGHYIKYNSNSGFVEENLRLTPQVRKRFFKVQASWMLSGCMNISKFVESHGLNTQLCWD